MKFCKDCKHCNFYGAGSSFFCLHPNRPILDIVTGEPHNIWSAIDMREAGYCSPDAKWFEPKEPVLPDPGDGWGLLAKGDKIIKGDETYFGNAWVATTAGGMVGFGYFRRRILPTIAKCACGYKVPSLK